MSDDLIICCAFCGKPFEPGPDSFVEVGFQPVAADQDLPEGMEPDEVLTDEDLEKLDAAAMRALGMDEDARRAMLSAEPGEFITTGAQPVCDACQSSMFADENGGE